jgi:hypothetical protein
MKKLFPIAVIAVFGALTLSTSCKKSSNSTGNYTCTCIVTTTGANTKDTIALPFNGVTKGTATTDCNDAQTTYTSAGVTTAACSL